MAREFVEDLAADGVVYGEARWAPEQHTAARADPGRGGRGRGATGCEDGMAAGRARGQQIVVRQLLTSMRHVEPTTESPTSCWPTATGTRGRLRHRRRRGRLPAGALPAGLRAPADARLAYTIHAGEAAGVDSIAGAVLACGATRVGHGVRIIEDVSIDADGVATLGRVAGYVRDRRIPLELCPSSNVQTGAAPRSPRTRSAGSTSSASR